MSGPAPTKPPVADEASASEIVRLRDGSRVTLRRVRAGDEGALHNFLTGLGAASRRLRFFTGAADVDGAARMAANSNGGRVGLVAHDALGTLVAHALYVQLDDSRAEVALAVADHLHARGLGTILVERLADLAERQGITHFVAEVLPENQGMLDVFRDGFDARVSLHGATDRVEFPTAAWRTAKERFPERPDVRAQQPDLRD